ncbi:hypothetical protein GJ496_010868 [Pomphorhynchus laevis]|nr:hypothetical protein GJ496_010868 [Pomphorhynchus laevis]
MEWTNQSENDSQSNKIKTCLIVNYLPQSVKEDDFTELFAMIGPLKSSKLMFDRDTGYSFGYGFVEYVSPNDALRAIETYNGYKIKHKNLKVAFSRPNTAETKNTTLYIKNLPEGYNDEDLINLVQPHGEIVQARTIRNHTDGKSKGIAFVIMATKREANEAINALNGYVPLNSTVPLIVKLTDQNNSRRINRNNRLNSHSVLNGSANNYNTHSFGDQYMANQYSKRNANNLLNVMYSSVNSLNPLVQTVPSIDPMHHHPYPSQSILGSSMPTLTDNWAMFPHDGNQPTAQPYPMHIDEWIQLLANTGAGNNHVGRMDNFRTTAAGNMGSYLQMMSYLDNQQNQYTNLNTTATLAQQQSSSFTNSSNPYPAKLNSLFDQHHFVDPSTMYGNPAATPTMLPFFNQMIDNDDQYTAMNYNSSSNYKRPRSFNSRRMTRHNSSDSDHLIYVYGLRPYASQDEVFKLFSPYGTVNRVDVVMDSKTQKAKGFAFVLMGSENEAANAVKGLNGFLHNGKNLQVRFRKQSLTCA